MSYSIKTLNSISGIVNDILRDGYTVGGDVSSPDAILVRSADMHSYEMNDNLLAIARAGAGVNNIPLEDCAKRGIVVFNTPGANANAVTEMVLTSMLLMGRDVLSAVAWLGTQTDLEDKELSKKIEKEKGNFTGTELRGKSIGVIGLGAIGALVANAAIGFGMDVYGYDPYMTVEHAWSLSRSIKRVININDIITRCDFITVHVPLVSSTRGMFDKDTLAKMKPSAALLNFSRGELVDGAAVVAAVKAKTIRAYATDFPTSAMLNVKGILSLPHLGASTPESEDNCATMAANELKDYLENGSIRNSVNMPDVELSRPEAKRVVIIHQNIPKMLGSITGLVADANINIANLINKSRDQVAYTVLDLDCDECASVAKAIEGLAGVVRVRVI